jgi:hypothetical protein
MDYEKYVINSNNYDINNIIDHLAAPCCTSGVLFGKYLPWLPKPHERRIVWLRSFV